MPIKLRRCYTRFRCSSHALQIEKGRHENIDRQLRFCPVCQKKCVNVVETEFHFLLECQSYETLRLNILRSHLNLNKTVQNFNCLMSDSNENVILKLAKFICAAFELRELLLKP